MFKFFGVLVSLLFLTVSGAIAQDQPVRSIVNVTGDLYRFQNDDHYGVFLVTSEGILLADPINADVATWLKGEFKERFDKEVKVVIYSHHHADHTSGGYVFKDSAVYFAHENAKSFYETKGYSISHTEAFHGALKIDLGGKSVVLYSVWPSHTDDMVAVLFMDEKALFLVDLVSVKRLPYRDLKNFTSGGTRYALQDILRLKFDFLVPGHGRIGTRDDIEDYLGYLNDLNFGVIEVLKRGGSVEEAISTIRLEKYKDWEYYEEWRELNIVGAYKNFIGNGYIPIKKEDPIYPRGAAQIGMCGWAIVEYDITSEGTTENVRILETEPRNYFGGASKRAAKKYLYFNISPVKGVKTKFTYTLGNGCRGVTRYE